MQNGPAPASVRQKERTVRSETVLQLPRLGRGFLHNAPRKKTVCAWAKRLLLRMEVQLVVVDQKDAETERRWQVKPGEVIVNYDEGTVTITHEDYIRIGKELEDSRNENVQWRQESVSRQVSCRWVPVSERLPDDLKVKLLTDGEVLDIGAFETGAKQWLSGIQPTHWLDGVPPVPASNERGEAA